MFRSVISILTSRQPFSAAKPPFGCLLHCLGMSIGGSAPPPRCQEPYSSALHTLSACFFEFTPLWWSDVRSFHVLRGSFVDGNTYPFRPLPCRLQLAYPRDLASAPTIKMFDHSNVRLQLRFIGTGDKAGLLVSSAGAPTF